MAAGQAQRVYEADPSKRVAICDVSWRPRWCEIWEGNPILVRPEETHREAVHLIRNAKFCRPYIQYPFTRDTGWRWTDWKARDHVGRLYLTDAERALGRRLRASGPFVLIEPSILGDSTRNKDWGIDRYRELVAACPEIPFVRVLYQDIRQLVGNVREVGPITFRQVVGILQEAAFYVGAEGALHHAAAAVGKPAVVIFGGSVNVETLGYPTHVNFADTGPGSPCGRWWPCDHCQQALARITVEEVAAAVRHLWTGGEP